MSERPVLGPSQVKALTHPLRVRLLRELRANGPATATLLAQRLGESSGLTSYHLRQLERHGLVEEAPETGDGRDRWWRPTFPGHRMEPGDWLEDPEKADLVSTYEAAVVDTHARNTYEWVATQSDWGREWTDHALINDYRLRLTPAQFAKLADELHRLVTKYERHASPGAEEVTVIVHAYPRRRRPFVGEAE